MVLIRLSIVSALCLAGASALPAQTAETKPEGWQKREEPAADADYIVDAGQKIPLGLINSVSTKNSAPGDRVYLETVFPVLVNGKIVIPPGSYVQGTVTQVKRPGRIKGRGELFVRFDSLTLPNGVTRDFRARLGGIDGRSSEELDRSEGKVISEGNKGGDARTIGEAGAAGASIGAIATRGGGKGAGIGAGAGAAAGLVGVLLSRGPDAVLAKGSTVEMVLDRPLSFTAQDLDFSNALPSIRRSDSGGGPLPSQKSQGGLGLPGRRF